MLQGVVEALESLSKLINVNVGQAKVTIDFAVRDQFQRTRIIIDGLVELAEVEVAVGNLFPSLGAALIQLQGGFIVFQCIFKVLGAYQNISLV